MFFLLSLLTFFDFKAMLYSIALNLFFVKRKRRIYMMNLVVECMLSLRPAFSRRATFTWFVVAFVGIVLRADTLGVTSIVRALSLPPGCYTSLLHFFHSTAYNVSGLMARWLEWLMSRNVAFFVNGRAVLIGDHTKTPKDSRRMPAVATLHQDSETASKPSFFKGHHWGCMALLVTAGKKRFAVPLEASIQEGTKSIDGSDTPKTIRTVEMARRFVQRTGHAAYLVLDAYFAGGPVFIAAACAINGVANQVHILTRAKSNVVAYMPAPPTKAGTLGRKPVYGEKLKLAELFDSRPDQFQSVQSRVYDTVETTRFLVLDLLWKPVKGKLRFILVETSRGRIILMSSDLLLEPLVAIQLYCHRVAIETLFDTFKNTIGGMCYHFWSGYLQPISRRPVKNQKIIQTSSQPDKTINTLAAIEKFVALHLLVVGMLQMLAVLCTEEIKTHSRCWLRTVSNDIPSEFVTRSALANVIKNNSCGFLSEMISLVIHQQENPPYINRKKSQDMLK